VKSTLKPPGSKRLKRKYDVPLSKFAFNFDLRRYSLGRAVMDCVAGAIAPGVTTDYLDRICHVMTIMNGAYPSPRNYMAGPGGLCSPRHHPYLDPRSRFKLQPVTWRA